MKRSDLAMIILIASVSVMLAYGVVSAIPVLKAPTEVVEVQAIDKYETDVETPSSKIFNADAINPTVDVTIGGESAGGQ